MIELNTMKTESLKLKMRGEVSVKRDSLLCSGGFLRILLFIGVDERASFVQFPLQRDHGLNI